MSAETRRRNAGAVCYRHPATWLVSGVILACYLGLNLWSPRGDHGFPFVWMQRDVPYDPQVGMRNAGIFLVEALGMDSPPREKAAPRVTWARCRAALPLEWFLGDFSRVESFSIPLFLIALMIGAFLVYFPFRWFDWFFGRRPQPFYRFGLARLFIGVSCAAVFFALTNESRTLLIAKVIVVLAVPATWLGITTWVVQRERALARLLVYRRRELRALAEEAELPEKTLLPEEIELDLSRPGT